MIYGRVFQQRATALGIEDRTTTPGCQWQNPYVERTARRECLNHLIIFGERHLRRVLAEYFEYHNLHRAHQGLNGDSPVGRDREPPDLGTVVVTRVLGGLHHTYSRRAA